MALTSSYSGRAKTGHASVFGRQDRPRPKTANAPGETDAARYRLLVASLFSSPASIFISNIIGIFVPLFCWRVTADQTFLVLSIAAGVTVVARALTVLRYCRRPHAADSIEETRRWDAEYLVGSTIFAFILGLCCYMALAETRSTPAHMINVVAGIAFSSGYVARNAARPFFVILQILCLSGPMVVGLFVATEPYYSTIGGFIALYALTNIVITFSINRNLLALAAANDEAANLAIVAERQAVKLDSALNSMTHGLAMFDGDLRLEVSNSRHLALYGMGGETGPPAASLDGFLDRAVGRSVVSPQSAVQIEAMARRALDSCHPQALEMTTEHQDVYALSVEPTPDGGVILLTENVTARKKIAATIERMAKLDSLTGLANRFSFNHRLIDVCAATAVDGRPFALLSIDLDNFKNVNDSLGHGVGDQLLIQVAGRLNALARSGDLVARFGGDEFLLLMHDTSGEAAIAFGAGILQAFKPPFEIEGKTLHVTSSVGIAAGPEHGTLASEITCAADMALYAAKAAGRNAAKMFTPEMAETLRARQEAEDDLREACDTRQFTLQYQPIVDVQTGVVRCCEALMRWIHPTKGQIAPSDFIPVAEQTGLIEGMGEWALRQACVDAQSWPVEVAVAVNVSAIQFKDPVRFVAMVEDALAHSGLAPRRLELEVTESLLIEDPEQTLDAMKRLRAVGVRFALDDFGTGYSSLGYLSRYPFSKVKIDRSFAHLVTSDNTSRSIIEVVCQLALRVGLQVVVEGIETDDQMAEIARLGAEQAQGYLLGRPQSLDSIDFSARRPAGSH